MPQTISDMKRTILRAAAQAGEGHVPSAFSVLDILWVLYSQVLRHDPANPGWQERDRFVLSKGHASLALYAVLARQGYFPEAELDDFGAYGAMLGGHPCRLKVPGVECSAGSLGHGLPMAVGLALGLRLRGLPGRVFALIGDGEANEGSVWEALLLAAHHKLTNLCVIVDVNHSTDRALDLGDLPAKLTAFGLRAQCVDGHDHEALRQALSHRPGDRPVAVLAQTVKGRGCRDMENNPAWHHRAPKEQELRAMLRELA
ncbi:MAG: transketolase [Humidesulfovibrio sp.]